MKKFLAVIIVFVTALSVASPATAATPGQRNALSKAKSYLSFTAFSKSGLVEQLEFEDFSRSDARWAVARVGVSWRKQAVKKARSYLSFTSFSRQGLIDQLKFDGFTSSQAVYGVNKAYR